MKSKKERLEAIRSLVQAEKIGSQEELLNRLETLGFTTTQATLSRDIRQLNIVKLADGEGNYVYRLPNYAAFMVPVRETEKHPNIEFSGNLAVVKTRPGYAMGIASDIDQHTPREILATIAGDDTILIIPREGVSRTEIITALKGYVDND
ncbi:transcriptional regulator of arginine metabolism [Parabacteroides sp. PFB2-10]|uniref:arginine repressor n=1 Tax=Parabacteroides sp. PFB2-10 TaxID=1742405 RepID=UPI0024738628|nr:ArgR family transcriptional regulator [Parabacteroides sp. PFB2-10]MDH6312862.1 transcriptional regulator of arginine metabolism [Parabacteroides sp. PFB2-10]MDL2245413.1 ArgR family transcriptional regulator [Parabacteroides sp. OttesenSCG-928-J18]